MGSRRICALSSWLLPAVRKKKRIEDTTKWAGQNLMTSKNKKTLPVYNVQTCPLIHPGFYNSENSCGYSTMPAAFFKAPSSNSIAMKASSGTSNGALIFHLMAGTKPNLE